jgi:hypothetical protein
MCIAFDGAYILEAPPADPASTDDYREPVPEITGASALPSAPSSIPPAARPSLR